MRDRFFRLESSKQSSSTERSRWGALFLSPSCFSFPFLFRICDAGCTRVRALLRALFFALRTNARRFACPVQPIIFRFFGATALNFRTQPKHGGRRRIADSGLEFSILDTGFGGVIGA